jgi:hypothetical protein
VGQHSRNEWVTPTVGDQDRGVKYILLESELSEIGIRIGKHMRFNKCIDPDEFLSSYEEPAKKQEQSDVAVSPETSLTDPDPKQIQEFEYRGLNEVVFDKLKESLRRELDENEQVKSDEYLEREILLRGQRNALYDALEDLQFSNISNTSEALEIFRSLLDIQTQICTRRSENFIPIRIRNSDLLPRYCHTLYKKEFLQEEICLIFSEDDIQKIKFHSEELDIDDPLNTFYKIVIDQSFDYIQYNEMTGRLLQEMTYYFLKKLKKKGFGKKPEVLDFQHRFFRYESSFDKELEELHFVEQEVDDQYRKFPVLEEIPRMFRGLIQIRIGRLSPRFMKRILSFIDSKMDEYSRARRAVSFDFTRLYSHQYALLTRQRCFLNLLKDILNFFMRISENEFHEVRKKFEEITTEIEKYAENMEPDSAEYKNLMKEKIQFQQKMKEQLRKVENLRKYQKLVQSQNGRIKVVMERIRKKENIQGFHVKSVRKINISPIDRTPSKRGISRMVMARRRRERGNWV